MPISTTALVFVGLAMAVAARLSAVSARFMGREDGGSSPPPWSAMAVGLAYSIGHFGVATPSFPPGDVTDRIPILAAIGALIAAFLSRNERGPRIRSVTSIAIAIVAFLIMLSPILQSEEFPTETVVWLVASAGVCLLSALNVALLDTCDRRPELWIALTVFSLGVGIVLLLSNSAILFELSGVLTAAMAASLLGARGRPIGGGIPVAMAILIALILEGYVYAFLPTSSALLLAASPALLWLTRLEPLAGLRASVRTVVATSLVIFPVIIASGRLLLGSNSDVGY